MLLTSCGFVRGYWRVGVVVAQEPRALVVLFARSRGLVTLAIVLIVCAFVLGRWVIFVMWRSVRFETEPCLFVIVIFGVYFAVAFACIVFDKKVFGRFVDVEA
jgi:hypothetical protein